MDAKLRGIPDEINFGKDPKRKIPDEQIVSEEEIGKELEKEEIFDIKSFLTEPRNYEEYDEIALSAEVSSHFDKWGKEALFSSYGDDLIKALIRKTGKQEQEKEQEKTLSYLKEKISGKIIVDLGAGTSESMLLLTKEPGAKVYIKGWINFLLKTRKYMKIRHAIYQWEK